MGVGRGRLAQHGPRQRGPLVRYPGQRGKSRAYIRRALGVVGGEREHRVRPVLGAQRVGLVELLRGDAEPRRVPADVVEREQARVAVEGGVLDALGHHRRGGLLEARDELRRRVEQPLDPRLAQHGAVLVAHHPGAEVGPVHREGAEGLGDVGRGVGPQPVEPLDLAGERPARLLELGLPGDGAEFPPLAGQLGVEPGQQAFRRGIDEQRADVVEELIAGRAGHGPVGAQLFAGVEDLLHPHAPGAAIAQPLEVAERVGEPVGVIDAQPLRAELEHLGVRRREDLGVLLSHPRQVVDVEEPAVQPGRRIDVEEPRAQLRVAPERVGVVRGHVVRHDVEHDRHPGRGQRAEPVLAAEGLADAARIDDVVAVRRALARLPDGREVQMRHAELAQVRHELAHPREPQLRPQLEPVGGAQVGHTRLSSDIERSVT